MTVRTFLLRWRYTTILAVLVAVFIALVIVPRFQERSACHDRGGAYVRGLWDFECVAAR